MTTRTARRPSSPAGIRASRGSAAALAAAWASIAVLAGCEVKVDKQGTPAAATQNPSTQSTTVVGGGGSALGKAKGSAENIRDKTEDYNKKLEEQIDDISNPK